MLPGSAAPQSSTKLLTIRDAAARLGLSRATVYKLCEHGALPHVRLSNTLRFEPDVLATYLAAAPHGPKER